MITYVPTQHKRGTKPEEVKCPFGERDLQTDECYSGGGHNRCPYFIRYEWCNEHNGCIACKHPPIDRQLNLFGW